VSSVDFWGRNHLGTLIWTPSMQPKLLRGVWSAVECPWVHAVLVCTLIGVLSIPGGSDLTAKGKACADETVDVDPATEEPAGDEAETDDGDGGIGFPNDRLRERQLDRGRRLVADQRWSDAAALFDEILAADRDSFFRVNRQQRTWQSIKSETNRVVGSLEKPGREAYELQFRARAERMLEQAVAANDGPGIVAVARRWFHTPAGYRATLLAAIEALEANQPLAAAAWLERLSAVDGAAAFEPTLSIMRAVAWLRAGDRTAAAAILEQARASGRNVVRIAGKDVTVSFPAGGGLAWLTALVGEPKSRTGHHGGDWVMHRGDAARNGVATASRPLLAARYRVPLARHPEESRLLHAQRRLHDDQELAVLPAGTPLAVDGTILVHTTMGLLAVDFETGKRVWLQPGGGGAAPLHAALGEEDGVGDADATSSFNSVFEDATSGTLASDGRLVFVVESHPDAVSPQQAGGMNFRPAMPAAGRAGLQAGGWKGGNTLSAYDVADRGALRWRLPARAGLIGDEAGQPASGTAWYLGAPLPAGKQLLVLVEEKGEVRLDVIDADTGRLEWSQPFAEVDERWAIDNRDSHTRRLAGLSPALAEGVLVCPTGAGAVVAIDLATRTLLWAHEYPRPREVAANGFANGGLARPRADGAREPRPGRWLDSAPVLAGGRVLLAAGDSQELLCLDLRRGEVVWRLPRKDRLYVAGVVEGRAIVVGRRGVEAIDPANGRVVWQRPFGAEQGSTSGRGILTEQRFFLPLDTPEVVEIDLADGRIVGRSAARGDAIPGNLLAYRGEVISQGADALEVFHQSAALELRIETALKADPQDAWAILWRGQLDLDRGNVAGGIAAVRAAHALQPTRVPANVVAGALLFALQRDFPQASPLWREAVALSGSPSTAIVALRVTVDGFLRTGDFPQAWEAARQLLASDESAEAEKILENGLVSAAITDAAGLIADGADPLLSVTPARWIQGRFAALFAKAPPSLRGEMDAFMANESAAAVGATDRVAGLRRFVERFGRHERSLAVRRQLAEALDEAIEAGASGEERRGLVVERDFVLLDMARVGMPADRAHAEASLARIRHEISGIPAAHAIMNPSERRAGQTGGQAEAWPIGRIVPRRAGRDGRTGGLRRETDEVRFMRSRLMNIPVVSGTDSFLPGLELAFDLHQQSGIIATDGYGRQIGDPFGLKSRSDAARLMPLFQPGGMDEAFVVGRLVFIRAGASIAAFEMAGAGGAGQGKGGHRPLWMVTDTSDPTGEARAAGFVMNIGGRAARQGNIPLGAKVSEPRPGDEVGRRGSALAGTARRTGVAILVDRSLKVYDPLSGRPLWERQRLPPASELIGDDDYLCVCPPDGRAAVVLAMADGRIVRTVDLPASERRLITSGRSILSVQPMAAEHDQGSASAAGATSADAADTAWARRVRLDVFDPVDGQSRPLGDYPGESRASAAGDGRLAVVDPSGNLSLLDIDAARVVFRTRLPDMPAGLEQLQVLPWVDRYLVLVGRAETAEEQRQLNRIGAIAPLSGMQGRHMSHLVTGSLWAVDGSSGDMLWPVPATILRHAVQSHNGSQLPVLLFARSIQPEREPDRQQLSVLCLDKRTGQAVYVDDRFNGRAAARPDGGAGGCAISGDPATHTIALSQGRRDTPDVQLDFSGAPTAPRPPFQAGAARSAGPVDPLVEIEYWIKKALAIPLPF
jgi:outer membrane protein assembly factor BamB